MASFENYPDKYLLFNQQLSKNLALVMEIEGVSDIYGIAQTFTTVRYGDAGLVYGLPGLVYGGLRAVTNVKPWIVLDTSLTIGQRIEPEQGKGNIGTLTMTLIDKDGQVSKIIAPGVVVDEVMAKREVKIWLGFRQTSYPEDYLLIYKGYITSIQCPPGLVRFQISDATSKKRQPLFDPPTTTLDDNIDSTTTTIPIVSAAFFYQQIHGPDGTYDDQIRTFIRIDDEIMEYGPGGISSGSITVTRGVLGTIAVNHDFGASVSNTVLLGDEVSGMNAVTMALKVLLSGWNGPCETNISLQSIGTSASVTSDFFTLGTNDKGKPIDAIQDLGLSIGDYFTITGATNPSNDVTGIITSIESNLNPNDTIHTDQSFSYESTTSAVTSFRSQFDTFPDGCGLKLRMRDVDVATMLYIRNLYFVAAATSNMRFYMDSPTDGKDFIDSQILLPLGCYGISRFGRISMSVTKPPLPGIGKLIQLDWTNVLDPDKIQVTRATNNRNFYNLISFQYNKDTVSGNFGSISQFLDTNSLNLFDQTSVLPITAPGITNAIGQALIQNRGRALLTRYKNCAIMIELTANWSVGSLIEVSDVVILKDEGKLKIMNFETGVRNLGTQLFEVIDRQYNIVSGNVKLKLLGGLGFSLDSRFGLYSPSSQINVGSTTSTLRLKPSYGQTNVNKEIGKWTSFFGLKIQVHSFDWSFNEIVTLVGINESDPTALDIDPPLSITPPEDYIIDINVYPSSSNKMEDQIYKTLYTHFTASVPITSGVSNTVFNVGSGDVSKFFVGAILVIHNSNYSTVSEEVKVTDITGTQITVAKDLGFTPDNTYTVEGIGFADGQSFYRFD